MTAFGVALILALVMTPCVVWLAHRWHLIDVPNHRSSHHAPIPRGGGIAVALATVAGVTMANRWSDRVAALVVGAGVLALTGLLDDRLGLPAAPRLAVQLITPAVLTLIVVDRSGGELAAAVLVAAVLTAGYVNAFNFMDGINAISGSQAAVAGGLLALVADHMLAHDLKVVSLAIVGAAAGFLPFNAFRASIFLGDVGSYFLGFWLAGIALLLVDAGAPWPVVLGPFVLYLLDTSSVLVRRALQGKPLMEAHREHAYQLLVQRGHAHETVAAWCAGLAAACALVMYTTIERSIAVQLVALLGCGALVSVFLAYAHVAGARVADGEGS